MNPKKTSHSDTSTLLEISQDMTALDELMDEIGGDLTDHQVEAYLDQYSGQYRGRRHVGQRLDLVMEDYTEELKYYTKEERDWKAAMYAEREARDYRDDMIERVGCTLNEGLAACAAVRNDERETRRLRDIYFETRR